MSDLEKKAEGQPEPASDAKSKDHDDVVIAELTPDVQDRLVRKILMQAEQYSSPHPHPDHLERYAALYPKSPEIVFEQFRDQGDHRRAMERDYMHGSERRANVGQWLAFTLVAAAIAAGVIVSVATGNAVAGATIITASLGGGILLAISGAKGKRSTMVQGEPTRRQSAGLGTRSSKQPERRADGDTEPPVEEGKREAALEPGEGHK